MQILIVCTTNNDTHRTCSWNTDRITARDNENIGRFIREVAKDCERDDDAHEITEVFIFLGGDCTRHTGEKDIRALMDFGKHAS